MPWYSVFFKTKRELPIHHQNDKSSSIASSSKQLLSLLCQRTKGSSSSPKKKKDDDTTTTPTKNNPNPTKSSSTNAFFPYMILMSGLFALSSLGTALELQTGVTSLMKSFWRTTATAVCLFPFAAKSLTRHELAKLSRHEWTVYFPLCAACYSFMTVAFVTSLDMTSIVNAVILSNMTSLIIIGSKAVMGLPVVLAEASGAVIGFVGATICALADDSEEQPKATIPMLNETANAVGRRLEEEASEQQQQELMTAHLDPADLTTTTSGRENAGNALAFFSSFGIAAYLMIAQRLRAKLDAFVFMFLLFVAVSIYICLYIVLFSGETWSFSMHPHVGLFGWMNTTWDRLGIELYLAIVCNIAGTTGYVIALKYFDPVVVSMVMLSEPAVAALQSFAAGVAPLPGLQIWIGDAIVVVGSVMVISSGAKKDKAKKDKGDEPPVKTTDKDRSNGTNANLVKRQSSAAVQRFRDRQQRDESFAGTVPASYSEDDNMRQSRKEAAV